MNLIVCMNQNLGIGLNGNLLYNIPQDMEYFKSKTTGKTVIMGRKTYQSLRIKPLPNRRNIVLSKSENIPNVEVCKSKQDVLNLISDIPTSDIYIIGGSNVYKSFIDVVKVAYVTKIYDTSLADTFFPINFDTLPNWILAEKSKIYSHNGLKYSFNVYKNI